MYCDVFELNIQYISTALLVNLTSHMKSLLMYKYTLLTQCSIDESCDHGEGEPVIDPHG